MSEYVDSISAQLEALFLSEPLWNDWHSFRLSKGESEVAEITDIKCIQILKDLNTDQDQLVRDIFRTCAVFAPKILKESLFSGFRDKSRIAQKKEEFEKACQDLKSASLHLERSKHYGQLEKVLKQTCNAIEYLERVVEEFKLLEYFASESIGKWTKAPTLKKYETRVAARII